MPYRGAAENEEEKLDAAEVEGFRMAIAAQKRRQNARVVLYVIGCLAGLALAGWILFVRGQRTTGMRSRPGCHEVYEMTFVEGEARRRRVLVCDDDDAGLR